jgi:ABC-type sugar transport system permease subunit
MYLLPHAILFLLFILYPIARSFQISFYEWGLLSPQKTFVGLRNYVDLVSDDPDFWSSFQHTLFYVVLTVPMLIVVPLALAVLFKEKLFLDEFLQTAIFLPLTISVASAGIIIRWIMDPQIGILNYYLIELGLPTQQWLNFPGWAMIVVSMTSLWGHVGFATIIFLAATRAVPEERYEAAMIDGAGRWVTFWNVTLPGIKPALLFVMVTRVIQSFNVFGEVYMVTGGGPYDSTRVLMYYLYITAFRFFQMGKASSIAWLMFLLVATLTFIQMKFVRERE